MTGDSDDGTPRPSSTRVHSTRDQTGTIRARTRTGESTTATKTTEDPTKTTTSSLSASLSVLPSAVSSTSLSDQEVLEHSTTPTDGATLAVHNMSLAGSPTAAPSRSTTGVRGPIGPRPGVYRPCARCRNKKTRCDRLKPSCSNCKKNGPDTVCVYDNDEPTAGVVTVTTAESGTDQGMGSADEDGPPFPDSSRSTSSSSVSSSATAGSTATTATVLASKTDGSSTPVEGAGSGNGAAVKIAARPSPTPVTPTNGGGSYVRKHGSPLPEWATKKNIPEEDPSSQPPPAKKSKQGSSVKGTTKPSPLRSSITNINSNTPQSEQSPSADAKAKSSSRKETSQPGSDDYIDIDSTDVPEDKVVTELSVAKRKTSVAEDQLPQPPVSKSHHKKHTKASSGALSNGGTGPMSAFGSSRIMVDLPTARPPPPFVIDVNQHARKWGKSKTIVLTLGGEISLPLWTSDQEMLLNEPRPFYMQNASLFSTGSGATNLARMAAFNQMDYYNLSSNNTPERGNTPESGEHSPSGPTASSATAVNPATGKSHKKKKRSLDHPPGSRRSREEGSEVVLSAKRKHGAERGYDGDDADLSSSRSTPTPSVVSVAPTPKPRAIPTRPRTFPCSFEGCGKSFMDKFHLRRHETRHVTQEITCGIDGCTKAYDSISTMRRHQSMIHKNRKKEELSSSLLSSTKVHGNHGSSSAGAATPTSISATNAGQEEENEDDDDERLGSVTGQTIMEEIEV
ncbi:hypothetical protein EMPS_01505 [Entomortierella parvispora]|uniref:Zn(2)-C6 fungal-type domain-containing protein n=1 Tax=Entomortierella parvispora TaxID=205924 RepID=A0A9P3LSQ9_9FUNG|nr:hypothetical protein EMPS_01505 [Entomortierella parvispora]